MGWLQAVDSVMERLSKAGKNVSSGFLLLMVLLINFEVLGRYFFGFSTLIADEYSAYFFVGCTFLGFSYSFRQGHFLRVKHSIEPLLAEDQVDPPSNGSRPRLWSLGGDHL